MTSIRAVATLAEQQAEHNFQANRAALSRIQPDLNVDPLPSDLEWIFGRDRALTLRDSAGNWLTGCSLPRRAAAEMLQKLSISGLVGCFLAPTHSAQLRIALDRLGPEQAIIAIVPQAELLPALLACDFFANDLDRHRLWFAVGPNWTTELKELFNDQPGLCTPTQFIRLPVLEEELVDSLIGPSQKIFSDVAIERSSAVRSARQSARRATSQPCVVTASQFRLWDDAGYALGKLFADSEQVKMDADDPCSASPLALARAAANCSALVIANTGRADLPGVLSDSIPWITWASGDRIPAYQGAEPIDRIITASPALAAATGWPASQIVEATYPTIFSATNEKPCNALALICSTNDLTPPKELAEYSSHSLLWEMIIADLRSDPSVLNDIDSFLNHRIRKLNIAIETLNRPLFIRELIIPAYQQSLARLLIRAKIPLTLHGKGWDRLPEFAPHAIGQVRTRDEFEQIVQHSAGLVHAWPSQLPHAIDALGRPVLRRRGVNGSTFLNDAPQILAGRASLALPSSPRLTQQMIHQIIESV